MNIEQYLAEHPDLRPLEVLIPENCAFCLNHNNVEVHVVMQANGHACVEEVE